MNADTRAHAERPKFSTRKIRVVGEAQVELVTALLRNIPIDPVHPLEIIIREEVKVRGLDANARMWVGPLSDIARQAWVEGRQFSDVVWHEYFKKEYLPEDDDPELEQLAKGWYRKWDYGPDGERVLVGSTTQLTKRGFANYLEQIYSYGAGLGVQFHERA